MQTVQIHLTTHEVLEFDSKDAKSTIKNYYQSCLKDNKLIHIEIKDDGDVYINPNNILYITVKEA